MKLRTQFVFGIILVLFSCTNNTTELENTAVKTVFNFSHNWDGAPLTSAAFGIISFSNANEDLLSIERLRYVISDITFIGSSGEQLSVSIEDVQNSDNLQKKHHLIDVAQASTLSFSTITPIPPGNYTVVFTFGLTNEANANNYTDLNSANFNVPDMLGGGYHYMQLDGKFINANNEEQGYNYHAIRAVDNPGANPTFPQDTFFTVNLGIVNVIANQAIKVEMNVAQWFDNPNQWNLNTLNQVLMPNSSAQIKMFENGQNVFSLHVE